MLSDDEYKKQYKELVELYGEEQAKELLGEVEVEYVAGRSKKEQKKGNEEIPIVSDGDMKEESINEEKKEYFTAKGGKKEKKYRQDKETKIDKTEKEHSFFAKLLESRHIATTFLDKTTYIYNGKTYDRDEYDSLTSSFIQEYADEFHKEIDDTLVKKATGVWKRRTIERYISREEFLYNNRFRLCLKNGIYCIDTHQLLEFDPEIFLTVQIPIYYNSNATCPKIKEIVKQIVCKRDAWKKLTIEEQMRMNDVDKQKLWGQINKEEEKKVDTIFEIFGYCLYADYFKHYLFLFQGPNDSGKGTLMKFLKKLLGEKGHASVSPQDLGQRFMPANLSGKYANICGDLSIERLKDTGIIKRLIGEDLITTEFKFYDSFQFLNYAKLIASLNDYFEISERDLNYLVKKIWLIECDNVFPEISNFAESVMTNTEMSGLFNESIIGLQRLLKNQDFSWKSDMEYVRKKFPIYNPMGGRKSLSSNNKEYINEELPKIGFGRSN